VFVHRWQLDALIDALGPHANDFNLDEWLGELEHKQTAVLLPRDRWPWIQAQLEAEIVKRGLPMAGTAIVREHWTARCPHNPTCGNATNCETLSIIAKARKARGA
jgi:hypothetical protein